MGDLEVVEGIPPLHVTEASSLRLLDIQDQNSANGATLRVSQGSIPRNKETLMFQVALQENDSDQKLPCNGAWSLDPKATSLSSHEYGLKNGVGELETISEQTIDSDLADDRANGSKDEECLSTVCDVHDSIEPSSLRKRHSIYITQSEEEVRGDDYSIFLWSTDQLKEAVATSLSEGGSLAHKFVMARLHNPREGMRSNGETDIDGLDTSDLHPHSEVVEDEHSIRLNGADKSKGCNAASLSMNESVARECATACSNRARGEEAPSNDEPRGDSCSRQPLFPILESQSLSKSVRSWGRGANAVVHRLGDTLMSHSATQNLSQWVSERVKQTNEDPEGDSASTHSPKSFSDSLRVWSQDAVNLLAGSIITIPLAEESNAEYSENVTDESNPVTEDCPNSKSMQQQFLQLGSGASAAVGKLGKSVMSHPALQGVVDLISGKTNAPTIADLQSSLRYMGKTDSSDDSQASVEDTIEGEGELGSRNVAFLLENALESLKKKDPSLVEARSQPLIIEKSLVEISENLQQVVLDNGVYMQEHAGYLGEAVLDGDIDRTRLEIANLLHVGGPEISGACATVKVGVGLATLVSGHALLGVGLVACGTGAMCSAYMWGANKEAVHAWVAGTDTDEPTLSKVEDENVGADEVKNVSVDDPANFDG